jgi:hypothetical protein
MHMAKPAQAGIDKAELKKLLIRSKKEPVNCAVAMGSDQALIMLDKIKQPRAVLKELEKQFEDAKSPRWGSAFVDVDQDPKLVILTLNKAAPGFARKLKKTLRGTGFSKVEVRLEDGSVAEAVSEEDEDEDAGGAPVAHAAEDGEAPENATQDITTQADQPEGATQDTPADADQPADATQATPFDAAGLTQRLTGLVRRMMPVIAADPNRQGELRGLATQAQMAIKAADPTAGDLIDQLETALGSGSASASSAPPPSGPAVPGADPAKQAALQSSPQIWQDTISSMASGIGQLKDAIRKDFADEAPEVVADIEKNLARIDQVTQRFDRTLADLLQSAAAASDDAARKAALAKARSVMTDHIKYAASEPLIALIDDNPFGVSPGIKQTLVAKLTQLSALVR